MSYRILIADDSRTVRRSLHGLLEQNPNWQVCAEAVDGADVIKKAQQFRPDVIVLDFFMPIMTGMEAARVLTKILPRIPILIVTFDVTSQLLEQARSVGIKGAAQKSNTQELVNGVEALLRNENFFYSKGPTQPV
jgi:DNA-binding NarL/FixJ family response regulator